MKTGNIYSAKMDKMIIFGPHGEKRDEIPLRCREVCRIIVDPRSGRFLAWSSQKLVCYRLVGGKSS